MNQVEFGAALLNADAPPPERISDGRNGKADKRFNVYRNNVIVSLVDAMETAFPVIHALVGEEFFKALAGVAVRECPPRTPLMSEFGQDFPVFLERFPPVAQLPYLPDVARIENAVRKAYHARDVEPLDVDMLGGIDPEKLGVSIFSLSPAVTLLRSSFPVGSIWKNNQTSAEQVRPSGNEDIIISRPNFDPALDILPHGAFDFLSALDGSTDLETALDAAVEGFDFSQTLQLCLSRGVLILKAEGTLQ